MDEEEESDEEEGSDEEESDDYADNPTYQNILDKAREENEPKWEEIANKYVMAGRDEDEAKKMADKEMLEEDEKEFKEKLIEFFLIVYGVYDKYSMKIIFEDFESYDNMSERKAMKKAVQKHMHEFDGLFEDSEEEEYSTEDEEG